MNRRMLRIAVIVAALAVVGGGAGYLVRLAGGGGTFGVDAALARTTSPDALPPTDWNDYIWPTDASRIRTSDFAEFRATHFHAGIDVSTGLRNGFKVFAVRDGWVSSITFEPFGYGWLLVLRHRDGYFSSYAHLDGFPARIRDAYFARLVAMGRSYGMAEWPDSSLAVRKGEVVAYTGDTGAGPAHLHFEVRDPEYNPVHPGRAPALAVPDSIPPEPVQLRFEPLDALSSIDGGFDAVSVPVTRRKDGSWGIARTPVLRGRVGLQLRAFDRAQGAQDTPTPYHLSLDVDGRRHFAARFDRIQNTHGWHIRIDRDHWMMKRAQGEFRKIYREDGNDLAVYTPATRDAGVLSARTLGEGTRHLRIQAADIAGNTATITADVKLADAFSLNTVQTGSKGSLRVERSFHFDEIVYMISGAGERDPEVNLTQGETTTRARILPLGGGRFRAVVRSWPGFAGEARTTITVPGSNAQWSDHIEATLVTDSSGGVVRSADGSCILTFRKGDVYRSMLCGITPVKGSPGTYVGWPDDIPLAGAPALSMRVSDTGGKPFITATHPSTRIRCVQKPQQGDGRVEAVVSRMLGTYVSRRDAVDPVIGISAASRSNMPVRITVRDAESGVNTHSIVARLDGAIIPLEYSEAQRFWFIPADIWKKAKGTTVQVRVSDLAGNHATAELKVR